ncbi:efflux RND transporter periplasmic adaptor subunit [Clostridium beijerinckii]|uniref:Efflux transporter periplasmic adaptor subunit n=1 Tax=Clostridium beijerinckii TaxID=1520 RepID=A0A0B5QVZ7_CLOBE|nr:efflux RND transporter periplasmic adaptor subunit [Clostridium beijerinckii]AJH01144.1 efflux transporter periplasmic adaptor subunit [Clostridium beijerinckii]AQS06930.1 cobalt-zinc-cadmium resistance protein CzcB [Clostridium beijerinckii]MBA2883426.1 multidrug resistance efflux pump [Clostridium beijerinckii]MBA2898612.1 multidrug resistance efflux pump [Clostridium beijerinckii]MBA2908013.1 multidrug resistance efflux pump [Clostridium beijerinckii]
MKKTMLVCLVVALMLSGCGSTNNGNTSNNSKTAETTTEQAKNKYIMAGKIEANDQANIASKISARVSEVLVDVGSKVNAGDTIVKLDTQDLQAQVNQAQAAVDTANATLTNAMNSTRPEQISQAQATLDSANEAYDVAKKNYDRTKALVDAGANTQQQLEAAHQQLTTAESQQKSAQEQLNMLNNGATQTSIDVYKAQVAQAEAALKTAQTTLNNGTLTAPISGVVNAKSINVGEMASPGATLVSISNPDALVVNAYAPLDIAGQLQEGQDVVVKVSEVDNVEFDGKITVINSKLNSQSRNILVKVSLADPNSQLKPGMFAEIGLKE